VVTAPPAVAPGRRLEIPVHYGGEDGPDLEPLAAQAGLTAAQVVDRHAGIDYRVFMLGFQPGFAYMGLVDPAIAAPRRASPRLKVSAGSVGIAGRQTGVYPAASPGGWQIIGRTAAQVFDQRRTPPALFAPGDTVAFTSVPQHDAVSDVHSAPIELADQETAFVVVRPGLFTTIQDSGLWGRQGMGVTVGGAMDRVSHALANTAVGNAAGANALEITIAGPELRIERKTTIAVAGANLSATLDGTRLSLQTPVTCNPGSVLRFGQRQGGARAYVAVAGGVMVNPFHAAGPLAAGVRLGAGAFAPFGARSVPAGLPMPSGGARLRVLPGPQQDQLPPNCFDTLCTSRFTVSPQSNRMGYRLEGPRLLHAGSGDILSDATPIGSLQVPASGQLIVLMADRQTTGGYPKIATVITADLPLAGQLAPGDWIEFEECTRAEAVTALREQEARLRLPA
jgi:biotin-dependent carboxylase-like uncharacterized protein